MADREQIHGLRDVRWLSRVGWTADTGARSALTTAVNCRAQLSGVWPVEPPPRLGSRGGSA